jgi:hypothetical protein
MMKIELKFIKEFKDLIIMIVNFKIKVVDEYRL